MEKAGIRSRLTKGHRVSTTDSNHGFFVVPNLMDRGSMVGETGKAWVLNITYIPTEQEWFHLITVINLGNRKVIGWALSITIRAEDTTVAAWKLAVTNRPLTSNRGVQYAYIEFTGNMATRDLTLCPIFLMEVQRLNINLCLSKGGVIILCTEG